MKPSATLLLAFSLILLSACNAPMRTGDVPTPGTELTTAPTGIPLPSELPRLRVPTMVPGEVALDFVARACEAAWSNNGQSLPCPGDPSQPQAGYVMRMDEGTVPDGTPFEAPSLLTAPAQDPLYSGIFGRYPAMRVQDGDSLISGLSCLEGAPACEVQFAVMYYDSQGDLHDLSIGPDAWGINFPGTGSNVYVEMRVSLASLAGQTVEFVLGVRDRGDPSGDRALWISPHIARSLSRPPSPTPTSTMEAGGPGVISGRVDMASAPPYLNDPIVTGGLGIPVVVVAFNLDDGTWWWYDTTPTHPEYEIPVPPGRYHLVAYGIGVGDIPYVAGGYTGQNPSCGLPLLEVVVGSNERVEGIDIADWNWSCHGTAYRPDKPDDVPIP